MNLQEINRIRQQFHAGQWPQFLEFVEITNLRGWKGQNVEFKFPVVAICGENGTGKSTILKVAAAAYENPTNKKKTYYPSNFFIETQWETITDVRLSYRIKIGNTIRTFNISRPSVRWTYPENRVQRNVYILDVSRTLPLDATAGYAKLAKKSQTEVENVELSEENREQLSYVLGKDYLKARFVTTETDQNKEVGLLQRDFGEVSQFHQGAGEDATLDLFQLFESIPNYSLLIIDEVEASLHPKSQRRLIEYLLKLSRTKRIQVILSTHSGYILDELPREARVLLMSGQNGTNVIYNVSTEFAMSKIDERDVPELYLYVEDKEAEVLVYEIIKKYDADDVIFSRIECVVVGPSNVVQMMGDLNHKRMLPQAGIGVLDGDMQPHNGCIIIPGGDAPEKVVYKELKQNNWENLDNRFGIGAGTLFDILDEAILLPDHHDWNSYVGDKVKKSKSNVWNILVEEYVKQYINDIEGQFFFNSIRDILDN